MSFFTPGYVEGTRAVNKPVIRFEPADGAAAAEAIDAATRYTGSPEAARQWYDHERLSVYGNKTPAELVRDGHLDAVLAFLDDLEVGATG